MSQKNTAKKILIVDDEESIRFSLRGILEDEGYEVFEAGSGEDGLKEISSNNPDLVFLDIWLPGIDGQVVLEKINELVSPPPVIMISGHATIDNAVSAIKTGAHDFIEKPLSLEKVLLCTARALEFVELKRENQLLKLNQIPPPSTALIGKSPAILELKEFMDKVAPLDTSVLLTGKNGTGKEVAARYIHEHSPRAFLPVIAINCAAIPEELIESELFGHEKGAFTGADSTKVGKFELANKGTLFLDEIGDMSLKTQAKILRILQEKSFERVGGSKTINVDVRIIAATNKDLEEAIANKEFREDLYYRLSVFPLVIPSLCERGEDILLLLESFITKFMGEIGLAAIRFDPDAKDALLNYAWPGNVRELKNFTERMMILYSGQLITRELLPKEFGVAASKNLDRTKIAASEYFADEREKSSQHYDASITFEDDFKTARQSFEVAFLEQKLKTFDGNISRMAEAVGLERSYLHRKLKSLGIAE